MDVVSDAHRLGSASVLARVADHEARSTQPSISSSKNGQSTAQLRHRECAEQEADEVHSKSRSQTLRLTRKLNAQYGRTRSS